MIQHNFRSYAYTENFELAELHKILDCKPALVDPNGALVSLIPSGGKMFLYNFGAITFLDVETQVQRTLIGDLESKLGHSLSHNIMSEEFCVVVSDSVKPKVEFNRVILDKLTLEREEVLALTLAQSAAMEYYERIAKEITTKVLKKIEKLGSRKIPTLIPAPLNKIIADAMGVRCEITEVLHLLDKPDLMWDDFVMEGLYSDLRKMFDLSERFLAIEHRLRLAFETLELLVSSVRDNRMFLAEVAIIGLFLADILISFVK
jgi:required for meiotic nuclear division protein 1